MYRELQELRNQPGQTYNFENSNPPTYTDDIKNYTTIYEQHSSNLDECIYP